MGRVYVRGGGASAYLAAAPPSPQRPERDPRSVAETSSKPVAGGGGEPESRRGNPLGGRDSQQAGCG